MNNIIIMHESQTAKPPQNIARKFRTEPNPTTAIFPEFSALFRQTFQGIFSANRTTTPSQTIKGNQRQSQRGNETSHN
ncbi:hypothetical protein [Bacillus thuringiensis]|uniref:hypothetical protein n=1 Tax=Bacillus thuringiensis TaxID=1428 RepID=UPI0014830B2A|nr:hypothetical protein [Bacillus thuringiensis]